MFGRAFTAETAEPGEREWLQITRYREGRAFGGYKATDLLLGAEYGLAEDWQVAAHGGLLRLDAVAAADEDAPSGIGGLTRHGWYFSGLGLEVAHRLRDPARDGWGLAMVGEGEIAFHAPANGLATTRSFGLGLRTIAEGQWYDGRLVAVYNLALEYESVRLSQRRDRHDKFDWDNEIGVSWAWTPAWRIGFELGNHNAFVDFSSHEHSLFRAGPVLSYRGDGFWASLSWLEQFYGTPNGYDEDGVLFGDGLSLREHERREITLKFGLSL